MCATLCPQAALTREEDDDGGFEYVVDPDRCIGCGFCAAGCPCGIWAMMENTPIA